MTEPYGKYGVHVRLPKKKYSVGEKLFIFKEEELYKNAKDLQDALLQAEIKARTQPPLVRHAPTETPFTPATELPQKNSG